MATWSLTLPDIPKSGRRTVPVNGSVQTNRRATSAKLRVARAVMSRAHQVHLDTRSRMTSCDQRAPDFATVAVRPGLLRDSKPSIVLDSRRLVRFVAVEITPVRLLGSSTLPPRQQGRSNAAPLARKMNCGMKRIVAAAGKRIVFGTGHRLFADDLPD